MNNEFGENEIDDIFKKAIEPVNTEPSERFWQKAAEDVISRGSNAGEKSTSRWKIIAIVLGLCLLALGYFSYKMESRLNSVEKQMGTIEKVQTPGVKNENTNSSENAAPNKVVGNTSAKIGNANIPKETKVSPDNNTGQQIKQHPEQVEPANNKHTVVAKQSQTKTSTPVAFNIRSHQDKQHKKPVNPFADNTEAKLASDMEETQVNNRVNSAKPASVLTSNASVESTQKSTRMDSTKVKETPTYVLKQPTVLIKDSTKSILLPKDTNLSRFSISAFFSPDFMVGYRFKSTDSWGSQLENTIKTGEKQSFSYTAGVKAEYTISSRFSINVGIAYQVFSFTSKPGIVYAQKPSGEDVGYYYTTSSGTVECPAYYWTPSVGDSIRMSSSSSRSYLEIPLQVKYKFINKEKYNLYFDLGADVNFCMAEKTTMDWHDYWNDSGVATVNGTSAAQRLYMSYYIGIGGSYNIGKYLSIYLEPGLHEAITSLDNNTSEVMTYPELFSVTAGLTYHIK